MMVAITIRNGEGKCKTLKELERELFTARSLHRAVERRQTSFPSGPCDALPREFLCICPGSMEGAHAILPVERQPPKGRISNVANTCAGRREGKRVGSALKEERGPKCS